MPTHDTSPPEPEVREHRACIECGEDFEPTFSKDGTYCFTCSVHIACACADEPA